MPGLRAHSSLGSHVTQTTPSGDAEAVFHAATYDPDTYELTQELVGAGGETYVHTADILRKDHEGAYRTFGENEQVVEGGRFAENHILNSNTLDDASVFGGGTGVGPTLTENYGIDPEGGQTAHRIQYDCGTGVYGDRTFLRWTCSTLSVSDHNSASVWLKTNDGTTKELYIANYTSGPIVTVTGEWKRFQGNTSSASGDSYTFDIGWSGQFVIGQLTADILLWHPQLEGTQHDYASEYIPTTTAPVQKVFATTNGNSVTDNVVTEADGVLLDPLPVQVHQDAATNALTNSRNMTLWSGGTYATYDQVGITGEANTASLASDDSDIATRSFITHITNLPDDSLPLTVRTWVKKDEDETRFPQIQSRARNGSTEASIYAQMNTKTGEMDYISGVGPYTIEVISENDWWVVLLETANNSSGNTRLDYALTPAKTDIFGSNVLNHAAMGSVIHGNVELHHNKTIAQVRDLGPIFTTTTAVSTDETIITHAAANHDNAEGTYTGTIDYAGDDTPVLSLGGVPFLYTEDGGGGDELVVDVGNITGNWVDNGDGSFSMAGGIADIYFNVSEVVIGTPYVISYELSEWSQGQIAVHSGVGSYQHAAYVYEDVVGYHSITLDGTSTTTTNALPFHGYNFAGTIRNISVKAFDGKYLKLTDGTNQVSEAITAGEHDFEAHYNAAAGEMQLKLDAATSDAETYDGSLGTGTITVGETGRDFKRLDASEIV